MRLFDTAYLIEIGPYRMTCWYCVDLMLDNVGLEWSKQIAVRPRERASSQFYASNDFVVT